MKNFVILTSFLLSVEGFAKTSETLVLQGIVPLKVSIAVVPETVASALILEKSQISLKVASVSVKTNSDIGYKVVIASSNSGKLKRSGGSDFFAYTMKYGDSPIDLSNTGIAVNNVPASIADVSKDLVISYNGVVSSAMLKGIYSDTLTFTVTANQ